MKKITHIGILLLLAAATTAQTDFFSFENAIDQAKVEDKAVMLVFSGSDWCKPCIKLKKDILETEEFENFSAGLVILQLDFPYKKKNALPKDQQAHNEDLAERFNKKGMFPKVLFLDADEKLLGEVSYEKNMDTHAFIEKTKKVIQ